MTQHGHIPRNIRNYLEAAHAIMELFLKLALTRDKKWSLLFVCIKSIVNQRLAFPMQQNRNNVNYINWLLLIHSWSVHAFIFIDSISNANLHCPIVHCHIRRVLNADEERLVCTLHIIIFVDAFHFLVFEEKEGPIALCRINSILFCIQISFLLIEWCCCSCWRLWLSQWWQLFQI